MSTTTFVIVVGFAFFALTIWAILDAAGKEFGSLGKKAAWMLVAAFPFFGFIVYFAVGYRKGKRPAPAEPE